MALPGRAPAESLWTSTQWFSGSSSAALTAAKSRNVATHEWARMEDQIIRAYGFAGGQ